MPGMWLELARADVGPYTSLMSSFLFSLLPSSCPPLTWEAPPPLLAGHPATGSANSSDFTDIPARNSWTHTSLVRCCSLSHIASGRGSSPYILLLRQWQRAHNSQEGQVEMVPMIFSAQLTGLLLIPHWEGGRERCPFWSQDPHLLPLGSLMVG